MNKQKLRSETLRTSFLKYDKTVTAIIDDLNFRILIIFSMLFVSVLLNIVLLVMNK
jgi:hypothetical protein